MLIKKGVAASLGIAIGKAYLMAEDNILVEQKEVPKDKVKQEVKRFKDALDKTKADLDSLRSKILHVLGRQHAKLIDSHHLILQDPLITREVPKLISSKFYNAEFALSVVLDQAEQQFEKIDDEFFHERKHDVFDVGKKILSNLVSREKVSLKDLKEHVVLVAHSLYPSDTLHIRETSKVLGFCMDLGSKSSHTAIFAQSMGMPAVVGLSDISRQVQSGDTIIVDGEKGLVIISPTQDLIDSYRKRREELQKQEHFFHRLRGLPATTRDGHKLGLMVNLDSPDDAAEMTAAKAEGVGLFRTEFLYMNRESIPTEDEQAAAYSAVAKAAAGASVTIRTADIGGDRATQLGIKGLKDETNPFMGFRGIRLFLKYPDLLKTQLRAIYRANTEGNIKIMIPMLSSLEELQSVKRLAAEAVAELQEEGHEFRKDAEIGVMIEIPAAAIILDSLLSEIDFVSIGTNDLVQYTLAVDRINQYVSELYDPYHPAVLRLINLVVQTAHKKGKPVSVCGEMASDAWAIPVLAGLGVDVLSVPPKLYLRVKHSVRSMSFERFSQVSQHLLSLASSEEIRKVIEEELKKHS